MNELVNTIFGSAYLIVIILFPLTFVILLILYLINSGDKVKSENYKKYLKFTCATPFILILINLIFNFLVNLFSNTSN
jgi:hypothetical protein